MSRLTKRFIPFTWQSAPSVAFTQGIAKSYRATEIGLFDPQNRVRSLTLASGSLPAGVALVGPYVQYNGAGAVASTSFTLTAADGTFTQTSSSGSATIQATQANQPPVWTVPENYQLPNFTTAGGTVDLTQYAFDAENDPMVFSRVGGTAPGGVTVSESGVLTVPAGITASSYTLTVDLQDASATDLPTLAVSSAIGAWTFGQPIQKGAATWLQGPAGTQVEIRTRWNDNSVKLAVVSGVNVGSATLTAVGSNPYASGTMVQEPTALQLAECSVDFGAVYGKATLSRTDKTTWGSKATAGRVRSILGPVMSEFHYYAPCAGGSATDPHLCAWWYVRAYSNGQIEVETVVENGWLNVASPGQKDYTPVVKVNNVTIPHGYGAISHLHHTRWSRVDWVSGSALTPALDAAALAYARATKLIPNYSYTNPDASAFAGLVSVENTAPFSNGNGPVTMGGAGTSGNLGNKWDALYWMTGSAYNAVVGNARCAGRWGIYYRDETTGLPPLAESYQPGLGLDQNLSGFKSVSNAYSFVPTPSGNVPPLYALTHLPTLHYHAALVSGRWSFAEACQFAAETHNLALSPTIKLVGRPYRILSISGTTEGRGIPWGIATLAQAITVGPSGTVTSDIHEILKDNAQYFDGLFTDQNALGLITGYVSGFQQPNQNSTWMMDLQTKGWTFAALAEPLTDNTTLTRFAKWHAKQTVGRMGTADPSSWCFRRPHADYIVVSSASSQDAYQTWNLGVWPTFGAMYQGEFGVPNGNCDPSGALEGTSGANPAEVGTDENNYWGHMQAALAQCVDLGVTGASDSWARMTGASNYNTYFPALKNLPTNGVTPR